jgi:hypothetical protein
MEPIRFRQKLPNALGRQVERVKKGPVIQHLRGGYDTSVNEETLFCPGKLR